MAVRRAGQGTERRQATCRLPAVRCTPGQFQAVSATLDAAGVTYAAWVKNRLLGEPLPSNARRLPADAAELRRLAGQLGSVGNNLNQLTRLANIGDLERPRDLDRVLGMVNEVIDECLKALGRTA